MWEMMEKNSMNTNWENPLLKKEAVEFTLKKNVSPINVNICRTNQLKFIELWNYLLPDYTHVTTSIQYVIKGD